MTKQLTRPDFYSLIKHEKRLFTEYKKFAQDIYRVEFGNSFLKSAVQKTSEGVMICYLDSYYEKQDDKIKLIGYVTFEIAYRINGNKGFDTVTFETA